jgi:hypothetical protein
LTNTFSIATSPGACSAILQAFQDRLQPRGEIALAGADAAARQVPQPPAILLDHPESRDAQSGIDAEDLQSITAVV